MAHTITVPGASGRYGYIAFYRGKQVEVYADSTLEAQEAAAKFFKARKTYDVDVVLAEKDGRPVTHDPSVLDFADRLAHSTRKAARNLDEACPSRDSAPGAPHIYERDRKGKMTCVFCGTLQQKRASDQHQAGDLDDACWEGYEAVGLKPGKGGQMVPNCVPSKTASGISVSGMRDGDWKALTIDDQVYAQVWFDVVPTRDDFGGAQQTAEWQVIITTTPDRAMRNPPGKELARETFRAVEKKSLGLVAADAAAYIKRQLTRHRNMNASMGRSARLMSRQEAILKKYLASGGNAMFFDELPPDVQAALQRVKDHETLWSDVDRWLSDNNNPHLRRGMFASVHPKSAAWKITAATHRIKGLK